MGMLPFILWGVVGLIVSAVLSNRYLKSSGVPQALWDNLAGTGIVPKWVSMINITSWALLVVGIIGAIRSFFTG